MSIGLPGMVLLGGTPLAVLQAAENAKKKKAGVGQEPASLLAPYHPTLRPGYQDTPVLGSAPVSDQGLLEEYPVASLLALAGGLGLAGFGSGGDGGDAKGVALDGGAGLDLGPFAVLGGAVAPGDGLDVSGAGLVSPGPSSTPGGPQAAGAGVAPVAAAAAAPAMSMGAVAGLGLAGSVISGAGAAIGGAMESKADKEIAKKDRELKRELAGYEGVRDFAGYLAQKTERLRTAFAGLGLGG